ncbi:hypothetical protein ACK3SF_02885 [Candidatus Nanosalina sp. VS9-1]|uniref:hypothetical protein n=1 Tax=Candidatus Nanosalina sp. VS9-1 TaxID=3388566 RepID=UPI0039DFFE1C
MEIDLPPSVRSLVTSEARHDNWETTGGLEYMQGWAPGLGQSYEDEVERLIDEGLESFEDEQDVWNFVNASGSYSNHNSFFYTDEDNDMRNSEGFFQDPYCHRCLTDTDIDVEDFSVEDAKIEPEYEKRTEKSFRSGYEKIVEELKYACGRHPEVSLTLREKEFREEQ